MAESRGVACTAGFESLNEAAWLGKPLLVVPVENHVEQHLNALDAEKAGLALAANRFDLTPLLRRWKPADLGAYRTWVRRAGNLSSCQCSRRQRAEPWGNSCRPTPQRPYRIRGRLPTGQRDLPPRKSSVAGAGSPPARVSSAFIRIHAIGDKP